MKLLLLSFLFIIVFSLRIAAQAHLANCYTNDHNFLFTYLSFKADNNFEYQYGIPDVKDFATGTFRRAGDSVFLKYNKDIHFVPKKIPAHHPWFVPKRADTLVIHGPRLYEVLNGKDQYYAKAFVYSGALYKNYKPLKIWGLKRKFVFWGPYQETRKGMSYMTDETKAVILPGIF